MRNTAIEDWAQDRYERLKRNEQAAELQELGLHLEGMSILDLAAGAGDWEIALDSYHPAVIVWQDLCAEFAMIAQQHHNDLSTSVYYTLADMNSLPYRDEMFDIVVCRGAIYYSNDAANTCREVARVLKPGGYFYLSSACYKWILRKHPWFHWKRWVLLASPIANFLLGRKYLPTHHQLGFLLQRWVRQAGFRIIRWLADEDGQVHHGRFIAQKR